MTTPLPSIERIGYTTHYKTWNSAVPLIENILREVVEAAVGNLQPSPTFVIYQVQVEQDGQIVLLDKSGNKINDTDHAPFIFYVFDEYNVTDDWNTSSIVPRLAYYAADCFMLCITREGSSLVSIQDLQQNRVLMTHPPQQGLAIVDIYDWVDMEFVKDGLHSMEAIPIVREALLKVFPPPPPPPSPSPSPSQDKDQTQQGKEESKDEKEEKTRTTMTGRPYILLVVITLVILLCLIGGVVYMVS
jgi:hypothetical protein